MASDAIDIGFLDGCFLHTDADHGASTLVSFHFVRFILFALLLTVVGPFVYRLTAAFFDLERDFKTVADHFDDVTSGLIYAYLVFTLGNYAHTFGWTTLLFYFIGLFGYSALVEVPFLRVSIPGWRSWSMRAWAVNLVGVALVLVAAGFHIRWAWKAGFLQWYLPLFVLATATLWLTICVQKLNNYCTDNRPHGLGIERSVRKIALVALWRFRPRSKPVSANAGRPQYAESVYEIGSLGLSQNSLHMEQTSSPDSPNQPLRDTRTSREERTTIINEQLTNLHYLNVRTGRPLPVCKCQLHLHHWQIFYILAFFTRFDRFASAACAGLVLGIFTQGSAAYGYDAMLERKHI
ncbi:hypothetical protein GGH12_006063 [Coemansia sp. RSA 1822]|nr:hypothetical protein LPJ76_002918 [Coemansia sp. RSA 638]KAJ2542567.1 hypothetical protein GGF49_002779 [Coemansia sp. RSA 1853]KAJ2557891.1 hypothetical protein GGH12_006063 [Coemansia sp. RSA 1822]